MSTTSQTKCQTIETGDHDKSDRNKNILGFNLNMLLLRLIFIYIILIYKSVLRSYPYNSAFYDKIIFRLLLDSSKQNRIVVYQNNK